MNVPLASSGWETVVAVVIDGRTLGGLALVLVLAAAALAWLVRRRIRRRAEQFAADHIRQLTATMASAEYLLWEAEVELMPSRWDWQMHVYPTELYRRLLGEQGPPPRMRLWSQFAIGEREEMDQRARQAMEAGAPGYTQEFKAARAGHIFWIREQVSILHLGGRRYRLVGFATDVTAERQTPGEPEGELTTERILEHAQCLLWRATVIKNGDALKWAHFDIPQSQFSDLLFGDRVYSAERGFWENMELPDQTAMDTLATRAILGGEVGYAQQFRVINREGRVFWLNERVSITPVADTIWSLVGVLTDATAQHEAEAARRQSEARLSYLLERADCLVWEATVKLQPDDTLHWSLHTQRSMLYRRIFGERDETELNWHTVKVPEFEEMRERAVRAIKTRASGYAQEFHVEKPEESIWLREVVTMVETQPLVFNLVGVITDITAQRRAEEAQRESERRLSALLERADCMIWQGEARRVADRQFDWNLFAPKSQLFRRLFGRDPNPEAKHQFHWAVDRVPETEEMNVRAKQAMLGGLPGYEQVFRYRQDDGHEIWLNEKVTIRSIAPDHWELVGIVTDITPQRGAEAALAAEKERLSVTLRAMSEAVITTGVDGVVQFMNPAAAALTGWDEREACGHAVAKVCCIENAHTAEAVELPVARVARGDAVVDLPPQTRLLTRMNQRRLIEGCCAPIHAVDSKVIGTVLVFRDVTDQERLEQELIRATRLESVGVLAGGIAHDFNNILTAVMGNLTLAQLDLSPDTPAAASLQSAEKAALRARDLTQQLLTFAKGGEPVRAAVRLDAIVREMTTFALHGSQVRAAYDLAPDLWPADADKGQIGRVVQNIVINAVQAMPNGGTLRVAARNDPLDGTTVPGLRAGNYVQIAIADTGEGIPPEHLARIFDPYFTTKQTGTGLGLAAVYSIVKKHSGHIDVESQVGQGTTFRTWLPALHGEATGSDSRPPWTPSKLKGRVLFMDDEKIIRDLASTLLKRFGLDVECAVDGAEAIAKYRLARTAGKPFDLVIMDLTIPGGMGGLAAVGELRTIDPDVKAIVSSGYSSDPVMANYRAHGFVAMIAKPYEVNEFARVLRETLGGASSANGQ